ncbi:chemotaxis protein [Xaviernesmea oryzae]|uniref:Chemotaxis protein n=1 Tax=Xaviernesmea oryzae TaxID=464029 RepID=A0A1Q9ARV5_9HYPH|nr:chemotaxis protein MotC [Xaviernesmea oryzae]OLP58172.1 chemotaxis protein [Xaviernesmea oryzae]SEL80166.1 chemotaxis protein MotC [Xaviernesmea oryzae]
MARILPSLLRTAALAVALAAGHAGASEPDAALPPYQMLRSLQFIQDSVVHGDHAAGDMQRYLLADIDKRLRSAPPETFDDPRNVDAALIYAMSGGNPQTLQALADRDTRGRFDNRIVDALTHYLNGKGALIVDLLTKTLTEYHNAPTEPYLALVLANALSNQKPADAIAYYDRARLYAPGSNIEEAALRRSLFLSVQKKDTERAYAYALRYARRFVTSPYAGQFADSFVDLAMATYKDENKEKVEAILSFMDRPRQREVYLRIARRAAIGGMTDLARLASEQAQALADPGDSAPKALASLYAGLVDVPSSGIVDALKSLEAIPENQLTDRDRALRDAARHVADEVLRAPSEPESGPVVEQVAEGHAGSPLPEETGSGASPFAAAPPTPDASAEAAQAEVQKTEPPAGAPDPALDPVLTSFVEDGKSKLKSIDDLLKSEKNP